MGVKKKAAVARRARRKHSAEFKAKVALSALREDRTVVDLCGEYGLHANQVLEWKRQLVERAGEVFGKPAAKAVDTKEMEAKIGRLALENDFLESALSKAGLLGARPW
jgi:transposase